MQSTQYCNLRHFSHYQNCSMCEFKIVNKKMVSNLFISCIYFNNIGIGFYSSIKLNFSILIYFYIPRKILKYALYIQLFYFM